MSRRATRVYERGIKYSGMQDANLELEQVRSARTNSGGEKVPIQRMNEETCVDLGMLMVVAALDDCQDSDPTIASMIGTAQEYLLAADRVTGVIIDPNAAWRIRDGIIAEWFGTPH